MATPQTGIFALGTTSHAYLEFDLRPGADAADKLAAWEALRKDTDGFTRWVSQAKGIVLDLAARCQHEGRRHP